MADDAAAPRGGAPPLRYAPTIRYRSPCSTRKSRRRRANSCSVAARETQVEGPLPLGVRLPGPRSRG
ncbi:MAG TPA: hypothetical protein VGQ83_11530 [Polyangia bacterium]